MKKAIKVYFDCKYATQTADSFNKYVSVYCHKKNVHIHGFSNCDSNICKNCEMYEKRR